jgi:predicted SAM-dependent methyltransferase
MDFKGFVRTVTTPGQRAAVRSAIHKCRTIAKRKSSLEVPKKKLLTLEDFEQPYRLHLGCGNIKLKDFCNVDVLETIAVDIVDDIRQLNRFPANSVQEIYACHVLEHFSHEEVPAILKRWHEVLQPGGVLRISVPDIDRIVQIYHDNPKHFNTPGHSPWIGLIYGGQSTPYDYHKTGFNFCWLKYLLENCGFSDCEEYPHEPHFSPGVVDASMAKEPFGKHFSLNMMSRKPLVPVSGVVS